MMKKGFTFSWPKEKTERAFCKDDERCYDKQMGAKCLAFPPRNRGNFAVDQWNGTIFFHVGILTQYWRHVKDRSQWNLLGGQSSLQNYPWGIIHLFDIIGSLSCPLNELQKHCTWIKDCRLLQSVGPDSKGSHLLIFALQCNHRTNEKFRVCVCVVCVIIVCHHCQQQFPKSRKGLWMQGTLADLLTFLFFVFFSVLCWIEGDNWNPLSLGKKAIVQY